MGILMIGQHNIQQFLLWVSEALSIHQDWRKDSWEDYEFRDGKQWNASSIAEMEKKGINPLTINRIFPIINLIQGHFINNQQDPIAKGRTKEDNELAQVMSESLMYVRDQNKGTQRIQRAFSEQITAGVGFMGVEFNSDPRKEIVKWTSYPWYSVWWDPYASPWLDKEDCRYCFSAAWKNMSDLIALFPEKKNDIEEQCSRLSTDFYTPDVYDEGTQIEDYKKYLFASNWVNSETKRLRPVELWYTEIQKAWFALMPDSRVFDLDSFSSANEQYQVIQASKEVVSANVKKMRVATFVSDLLLQDIPSPYSHDEFPFIPFVSYLDRFNFPFGIPRQIKEQDMEVNKRRSMALSLLSNRRVYIEEGAVSDINVAYDEANRQDGFIVLKKGKIDRIKIQELSDLASPQTDLMQQTEREIQEVSGANDEALGYASPAQSGVALAHKQQQSSTVTSSLLANARESLKRLGELTMALIQDKWTSEKVLRIVDRLTGSEKFVAINTKEYVPELGAFRIKNDITQARFDIVIANKKTTDTMREKNMELIFSAINKSPPEAVASLLNLALELSDIPNKDELLRQVRAATGVKEIDDNLTEAEKEAEAKRLQEAQQAKDEEDRQLEVQKLQLSLAKEQAEVEKLNAETLELRSNAAVNKQKVDQEGYSMGQKLGQELLSQREQENGRSSNTSTRSTV